MEWTENASLNFSFHLGKVLQLACLFAFSSDIRSYDVPFVFKRFDIYVHTDTFKLPVDRQIRLTRAHLSRDLNWLQQQTRVDHT